MADAPKDLLEEVKKLEEMFIVGTPKLKEITSHFVSELEKGKSTTSPGLIGETLTLCRSECRGRQHCMFPLHGRGLFEVRPPSC